MGNQYKKNRKNRSQKNENSLSNLYLLPVLFIIAIVPLIVFVKVIELDGLEAIYWKGGTIHTDFFHYYKSMYFIAGSYVGSVVVLILYWMKRLKFVKSKYYIPLGVYALFSIISAIFADDVDVALRGYIEMFQGVFVLVGYVLFVITIFNLVREDKHIKAMIGAFIFVGVVVGFIGVGQYFGHDIFKTEFGRLLILPKELHDLVEGLNIRSSGLAVYATLYNSNFVGSFAALMIPLSFSLYFYQKRIPYAALSLLFIGLMVLIGFGSNSRAGIIGVLTALVLIAILFRKQVTQNPLRIVIPFVVLLLVGFGLNIASDGRVLNEIKNLSFTKDIDKAQDKSDNTVYLDKMIFDYYTLEIMTEEQDLHIEFIDNELYFSTLEGDVLEVVKDGQKITFIDETYKDFSFTRSNDISYYSVKVYSHNFNIYLTGDGFKFQGLSGDLFIPSDPDKVEFLEGYGSLFSSRAYIWSRSIPLLKKYIIIGAGPDMYPVAFPQDDYIGKLNYWVTNSVVDKPHNMYLQTGINTGVISLIALLSIFGMYLFDSTKLFLNNSFETYKDYIGAGMFAGVTAYLVAGMFNDQVMSVTPLFYGMLGLGITINHLLKEKI